MSLKVKDHILNLQDEILEMVVDMPWINCGLLRKPHKLDEHGIFVV